MTPSETSRWNQLGGGGVAFIGQGDPVAEGGHPVRARGPGRRRRPGGNRPGPARSSTKQAFFSFSGSGQAHGGGGGADVLEGGGRGTDPVASFSSCTNCQLLSASRKLMYPGLPQRISTGRSLPSCHIRCGRASGWGCSRTSVENSFMFSFASVSRPLALIRSVLRIRPVTRSV